MSQISRDSCVHRPNRCPLNFTLADSIATLRLVISEYALRHMSNCWTKRISHTILLLSIHIPFIWKFEQYNRRRLCLLFQEIFYKLLFASSKRSPQKNRKKENKKNHWKEKKIWKRNMFDLTPIIIIEWMSDPMFIT